MIPIGTSEVELRDEGRPVSVLSCAGLEVAGLCSAVISAAISAVVGIGYGSGAVCGRSREVAREVCRILT